MNHFVHAALLLCAGILHAAPVTFHVDPSATPRGSGSEARPFSTLAEARDAIRALKGKEGGIPDGGAVVLLRRGTYFMAEPLQLAAQDSGRDGAPIVWKAANAERVIITGGKALDGFVPLRDPSAMQRIDPAHHAKVMQATLDIADLGNIDPAAGNRMELFHDGKFMPIARFPNQGWIAIGDVPQDAGEPFAEGTAWRNLGGVPAGRHYGRFHYMEGRPSQWTSKDDLWIEGYFNWDWAWAYQRIDRIDAQNKLLHLAKPYHNYGFAKAQRYAFVNVLEELDSPGEWYVDRSTKTLYFCPPSPITADSTWLSLSNKPLIDLAGVSHVAWEGIEFRVSRAGAMSVKDGERIRIAGCTFTNFGDNPIAIDGGTNHLVQSCDISEVGRGGIRASGGDRKKLEAGNHAILNNHIHHFSRRLATYTPAISLAGVGNRAAHNKIHDAPHMALGWSGNEHLIELNEVFNVVTETNDAGALYSGRDPSMQGTIIRHNYFHHIRGPEGHGTAAVYLDDHHNGHFILGNVFHTAGNPGKGSFGAVFIHAGRYNEIRGNIFIDCDRAYGEALWTPEQTEKNAKTHEWQKRLHQTVDIARPPYTTRYPWLANVMADHRPNIFAGNVLVRVASMYKHGGPDALDAKDNWETTADPGFADPANRNFALKPDSDVFQRLPGFQPIPFDKIGLRTDPYRRQLPKPAARQP